MRRGNLFWGLILIILGGLFLLRANGVITDVLGWFWPLGLIMVGIWVLGARYLPRFSGGGDTFSINLDGATQMELKVDHGAGSLSLSAGAPAGVAISGTQGTTLEIKSQREGDRLGITLDAGPSFLPFLGPEDGEWRFNLSQEVPVSIKLDAGASSLNFDLTDVKLTFLGIDAGASRIKVKLPASANHSLVDIEAGAASVELFVPDGVGARILIDQGASSVNINQERFPMTVAMRNVYQSMDYDSVANKVEINLRGGASSVKVS